MQVLWNSLETLTKWVVLLVAVGVCASGLMSFVMQQFFPVTLSHPESRLPVRSQAEVALVTPSADLFGVAATAPVVEEPVKETNLKLVLKGVFPESKADQGMAVIALRGRDDTLFQVGEEVSRGVALDAVYSDHVVLLRGRSKESLYFEERVSLDSLSAQVVPTEATSAAAVGQNYDSGVLPGSARSVYQASSGDQSSSQANNHPLIRDIKQLSVAQMIKTYEQKFKSNPQQLLSSSGLQATGSSYKVTSGSPLISIGMKAGDEILSVNGRKVGDIAADAGLADVMRKQGVARIEMRRGSRRFFVNYPIR